MKNLMVFVSPNQSFNYSHPRIINDALVLIKVQIENSIELGWKAKDILLYTNFAYQYGKIKAKILKGVEFNNFYPQASKINAVIKLFDIGVIKKGELYWYHDLDAYQLVKISPTEIKIKANQIALTDYGRTSRWSTGSIFFKHGSKDIFQKTKEVVDKHLIDEERALGYLTKNNRSIKERVKKIDKSYNFTAFNIRSTYSKAKKPIKVAHFHPLAGIRQLNIDKSLDFFMGRNKINTPLIDTRLYKIFRYHRIK